MAALEAATQPASVSERKESLARTDVRALGGRVKPGHDEFFYGSKLQIRPGPGIARPFDGAGTLVVAQGEAGAEVQLQAEIDGRGIAAMGVVRLGDVGVVVAD